MGPGREERDGLPVDVLGQAIAVLAIGKANRLIPAQRLPAPNERIAEMGGRRREEPFHHGEISTVTRAESKKRELSTFPPPAVRLGYLFQLAICLKR